MVRFVQWLDWHELDILSELKCLDPPTLPVVMVFFALYYELVFLSSAGVTK